jgi:hypothetical protein
VIEIGSIRGSSATHQRYNGKNATIATSQAFKTTKKAKGVKLGKNSSIKSFGG